MTLKQRRVFSFIPAKLQTPAADKILSTTGDIMFEPENAGFISGYIGNTDFLTDIDVLRTPQIKEIDTRRQKYQLSPAAVVKDDAGNTIDGVFYDDMVRFLESNGAITNDENRLFATPFYSWSPPIDYDKHINFSRYYWLGDGDAIANGSYVTKEMYGSQLYVYVVSGGTFNKTPVKICNGLPSTAAVGDIVEDASTINRFLYHYDGYGWKIINFKIFNYTNNATDFDDGDVVYIPQTGKTFNRFTLLRYSVEIGRWLSYHPIISNIQPEAPVAGMIWEDITNSPARKFYIFDNNIWQLLNTTTVENINGIADPNLWFYDIRMISNSTINNNTIVANDYWAQDNWWIHYDDMSPNDKHMIGSNTQSTRPIIEYWGGIESRPVLYDDYSRNAAPVFKIFTVDPRDRKIKGFEEIDPILGARYSSIYYYSIGSGSADTVLGFPLVYNSSGEYTFDINIESTNIQNGNPDIMGYRYFKDSITGVYHSIWRKSSTITHQNIDVNGYFDVPAGITSNADHTNPLSVSRSQYLKHMASVISSQNGITGNEYGVNSYRWSEKNIDLGSVIIDCENSLLRAMALMTEKFTNIPDIIRFYSKEYNRAVFRFLTKLNKRYEEGAFFDVSGELVVSAVDALDDICTELFFAKNNQFPYYYSSMGTYIEKTVGINGTAVINNVPKPIMFPTSPVMVGVAQAYTPEIFIDYDNVKKIRGHDGSLYNAYNDGRDLIILELENRFFSQLPTYFNTETVEFSSRFAKSNFILADFYGNFTPTTNITPVDIIIDNYLENNSLVAGTRVFSKNGNVYANWSGQSWFSVAASVDDVFFNKSDNTYYIFNGFTLNKINYWNFNTTYDYSYNEVMTIIRRDFERWTISHNLNYVTNTGFDQTNKFTWNYRTSGLEGYYAGIYKRIFRTPRLHSHPWEILGYTIRPDWWFGTYVPTIIKADGTPRYEKNHVMWDDISNGVYNKPLLLQNIDLSITAPFPIDIDGELEDPITAGIVSIDSIDLERISDGWVFGDGAPIEQAFFASLSYPFATALAGYLMKPGIWLDTNWAHLFVDIGKDQIWNGPHVVYNKTLTRAPIAGIPVSLGLDSNGDVIADVGIQLWVAEYIKRSGADVDNTLGSIVKNSSVQLGWKAAGFLNNNRTVVQKLSGTKIPFEDLSTIVHTTPPIKEYFSSGMVIVRDGVGYRVYGYDIFNPYFTIDEPNIPTVGGLTEQREEFIVKANQTTFVMTTVNLPTSGAFSDTASIAVIINGITIKSQYYTILNNKTLTIDPLLKTTAGDNLTIAVLTAMSNTATRLKAFKANGVVFTYVSEGTGVYKNYDYGHYFDTAPQVINFMVGYGRFLQQQGWVFEDIYNNSPLDWINGAQRFASWVVGNEISINNGEIAVNEFFFSPIAKNAKFSAVFGTVTNIESFQNGAYGIINSNALPINSKKVNIKRISDTITINSDSDNEDIFGIRLYVVETQHVVFFSNVTKFGDIIYDPLLALSVEALKVNAYRTSEWSGKFEADGFVIQNNNLIPNFEKQAFDITKYYDRIDTIDDPVKRDAARALVGWVPNDLYMDPIGADDRSRFDYHLGMIKAKGTVRPIKAFAKGSVVGADNAELSENWLWRIGDFGDTRKSLAEFIVTPTEILDDVQVIRFTDDVSSDPRILCVNSFDRNLPIKDSRWINPPTTSVSNLSNVVFPTNANCIPQTADVVYEVKVINRNTDQTVASLFHYDPQIGKFDPTSLTQIDYWGPSDPASYTDGYGASYSSNNPWGEPNVGKIWWDVTNINFTDYASLLPDYRAVSKEWGKLKYFNITLSLVGNVLTINTLDPYTNLPSPHGFAYDGFTVTLTDINPSSLNGIYSVNVVDTTTLQTITNSGETLQSTTGTMITGSIDIYQWIRSTLTPTQYITQGVQNGNLNALPYGLENASYVTSNTTSGTGATNIFYYYWVKSLSAISTIKELTAYDITSRLQNPNNAGLSWFAPINKDSMLIHLGNLKFETGFSIQVTVDGRKWDTHDEWLVFSENSSSTSPPLAIFNKIVDSVLGYDIIGNLVPAKQLGNFERMGSSTFPAQTIYKNTIAAKTVMFDALNSILSTYNINDNLALKEIIKYLPSDYWGVSDYVNANYKNDVLTDVVATIAERDRRTTLKYFINGDVVKVVNSTNTNPWTNLPTPVWYILENGMWVPIRYEGCAVLLNQSILEDTVRTRETLSELLNYFPITARNMLMSACLNEMLYQNPYCDWFEKTSFVDMRVSTNITKAQYVQPDQVQAIIDNFEDVKPFRTKLRNISVIENIPDLENITITVTDTPVLKTNILFNRLNTDVGEEGGIDGIPADVRPADYAHAYYNNFGIDEYSFNETIVCDNNTDYEVHTKFPPFLYKVQVNLLYKGVPIDITTLGLTVQTVSYDTSVIVKFSSTMSSDFSFELLLGRGFYPDIPTTFDPIYNDTFIKYYGKDLQHRTYTYMQNEYGNAGTSEDRINAVVTDNIFIAVTTSYTDAYSGIDGSPVGLYGADGTLTDDGDKVFYMSNGTSTIIPAGICEIPTHAIIKSVDGMIFEDAVCYNLADVQYNGNALVLGVDYTIEFRSPFNRVVLNEKIDVDDTLIFIYNGWYVGDIGTWTYVSSPSPIDYNDGYLTLETSSSDQNIVLNYKVSREAPQSTLLYYNMNIVNDVVLDTTSLSNIIYYGLPDSGYKVLVFDTGTIIQWNGNAWVLYASITEWVMVYVISESMFYKSTSTTVAPTDIMLSSNLINYPRFGQGVASDTYPFGQTAIMSDADNIDVARVIYTNSTVI